MGAVLHSQEEQLSPSPHLSVFPRLLQVHMALQLCPILGDHTYAARVGTVLGQRFLWPAETTKPQIQVGPLARVPALCGLWGLCLQIPCAFGLGGRWLVSGATCVPVAAVWLRPPPIHELKEVEADLTGPHVPPSL